MYEKRYYDTMIGYLTACQAKYVEANKFFDASCSGYLCTSGSFKEGNHKFFYAHPSNKLRFKIAREFEKFHWKRSNPNRLEALSTGIGADFSYLQCFFVGTKYGSTSLSGDAYDYCRRKFTQSTK